MNTPQFSTKRLAISKANAQVVIILAVTSFLTVFCIIASSAIWEQIKYQNKVINKKNTANVQLQKNIQAFNSLESSYSVFNTATTNAIGGSLSGTGDNDGSNSKIILDALPSSYDFPALTSSIEKILTTRNYTISNITGTDDQLNQSSNISSPNPQSVPMPFSFTVANTNYNGAQQLITALQESIRPIQIDTFSMNGGSNSLTLSVTAHTYYQPAKSLSITKEKVK